MRSHLRPSWEAGYGWSRSLVSTDVRPILEVVGDYRGAILVPPREPMVLAEALLTTLRNLPDYAQWGDDGGRWAYTLFGREALAERTSVLYERLIAARWPERARGS